MKKFLFLTLSLMLVATGAWAIKGKVDTTVKAKVQVSAVDKQNDKTQLIPLRDRTARFAEAPEGLVTLPYTNTFDTDEEIAQLSLYDANQDQSTWGLATDQTNGGNEAAYAYNSSNAADDYLFMPPMELDANASYTFSVQSRCRSTSYPERFEVVLMPLDEEADMITVIDPTDVSSNTYTTYTNANVVVPATGYYQFAIHAISDADMFYLYVDNISVKINADKELSMTLNAPASVKAGQDINVTAVVTNGGSTAAQNYTVTVTMGEEELVNETVADELAVGAKKEYSFQIPTNAFDAGKELTFAAEVVYDGDEVPADNSATATTTINESGVEAPLNLTAEGNEDGTIVANWEVNNEIPETYTEDFEDTATFPAFGLGGITASVHNGAFGKWTLYDPTGANVYGYQSVTVPNLGDPQAWFVMAPGSDQLSQSLMETQAPHSGEQMITSYCCPTGTVTDHWLISPQLNGEAQTISFFARELTTQYGAETFEVLASTTDNDPANFTLVEAVSCAVESWTEYSFDLPAGTKYFAIRHTSDDIFALFVDDITFSPGESLSATPDAFNIYLDGELVETVSGDVFTYTFEGVEPGNYVVQVTAVYGDLESEPAEAEATVPGEVVEEKFAININQTGEGTITCPEEAAAGETVTFTIDPGENTYELSITDASGEPIEYQPMRTGIDTYTFVMPDGPVNINVTFSEAPITGVNDINAGKTIANVRYYNMAGQRVAQANGATIVVTTYTDGTTRTVKMMK